MSKAHISTTGEYSETMVPSLRTDETSLSVKEPSSVSQTEQNLGFVQPFYEEVQAGKRFPQVIPKEYFGPSALLSLGAGYPLKEITAVRIKTLVHYETHFDTPLRPWLPQNVLDLLNKMKKQAISEREAIRLMNLLAERAIKHYSLAHGKFVAITLDGRIVEAADTKIDLLKKVQSARYPEQIFVWKVGSYSFTGWK